MAEHPVLARNVEVLYFDYFPILWNVPHQEIQRNVRAFVTVKNNSFDPASERL